MAKNQKHRPLSPNNVVEISTKQTLPLDGVTLAVVGPLGRKDHYTEELEKLGATVLYATSEEKKGQVGKVCRKADAILFVTTFTSHSVDNMVRSVAESKMIPCKLVTTKGKDRLAEEAISVAKLIPVFRAKRASGSNKSKKQA